MALQNSSTAQPTLLIANPVLRILSVVLVNLAILAAVALPILEHVTPPGPETPWYAWAISFTLQPLFAVQALLFFRWIDRRPLSEFPLRFDARARQLALWGCVLTIAMMAAFVGLTGLAGVVTWRWNTAFHPATMVLMTIQLALAGLGEEFLFRGYLIRTLDAYGPRAALLISSLVFALMHMAVGRISPLDLTALFLHGLFFGAMVQRSNSVWPALIVHALYNALTSWVWSGDLDSALLAFDGNLGWLKWTYKGVMTLPYLLLVWYIYRSRREA